MAYLFVILNDIKHTVTYNQVAFLTSVMPTALVIVLWVPFEYPIGVSYLRVGT